MPNQEKQRVCLSCIAQPLPTQLTSAWPLWKKERRGQERKGDEMRQWTWGQLEHVGTLSHGYLEAAVALGGF